VEGPLEGKLFPIHEGENKLARNPLFDHPFPDVKTQRSADMGISRDHAELIARGGVFLLQPLPGARKNPTVLNGDDIPQEGALLQHGDCIGMGKSRFIFLALPPR